jgi:hypothetical protein
VLANDKPRALLAASAGSVALVAGLARIPGALHSAMWQDEVASARVISEAGPLDVIRQIARTESTPPFWYALGWIAHRTGVGVQDVRFLSVAAGMALAAAIVVCARRLVPLPAATAAGLAVALGYQFVFHGRELRAYELAALLTVVLAVAAERLAWDPTRGRAAQLAAAVAFGTLTHYFVVLSVVAVAVWLVTMPPLVRRRGAAALAAGLVPLAVWAPIALRQFAHHRFSFIGPFSVRGAVTTYWLLFVRAQPHTRALHVAAPVALLLAVLAGAVLLARASSRGRLWALLTLTPVALGIAVWLAGLRIYDIRNLICAGPFAAIAVAALLARLPRGTVTVASAGLCFLLVLGYLRSNRVQPVAYDRIAAALVAEGWHAGDPIVVYGDPNALWGPLEWYLPGRPRFVVRRPAPTSSAPSFVIGAHGTRVTRVAIATRTVRSLLVARVRPGLRWPGAAVFAVSRP